MNYLKEVNFKDEDIKYIEDNLEENDYIELSFNSKRVLEDIKYLDSIGIKNIQDLIVDRPSLFYEDKSTIEDCFNKSDILNIVDLINSDSVLFEEIGL